MVNSLWKDLCYYSTTSKRPAFKPIISVGEIVKNTSEKILMMSINDEAVPNNRMEAWPNSELIFEEPRWFNHHTHIFALFGAPEVHLRKRKNKTLLILMLLPFFSKEMRYIDMCFIPKIS